MNPRVKIRREQILRMLDGARVQLATGFGLLEMEADVDTAWQPLRKIPVPDHIKRHHDRSALPRPKAIWANDTYEVMEYDSGDVTWLSIKRYDRAAVHNWRHMQQMKNEICGEFREGVELYPSEARIADNANQFHMYVLPEGMEVPLGFPDGMVLLRDEDVETYNSMGTRGRQEPLQPGLTIGAKMQEVQDEKGINATEALRSVIGDPPPTP
jgi:hypothetical protein